MFDLYTFVIHEREPLGPLVISFHLYLIRQRLKISFHERPEYSHCILSGISFAKVSVGMSNKYLPQPQFQKGLGCSDAGQGNLRSLERRAMGILQNT